MRIRAIYHFYLDFFLPRIDNTEAIQIQTKYKDCDVTVVTWGAGDPLYPSEVDKNIPEYVINLTPVARPEVSIHREAKNRILDRISVQLEWEQSVAPAEGDLTVDEYLARAVFAVNMVLDLVRVSGDLVDVKRIARTWDSSKSAIEVEVHSRSLGLMPTRMRGFPSLWALTPWAPPKVFASVQSQSRHLPSFQRTRRGKSGHRCTSAS